MTSIELLDWWRLGVELRASALDCWGRLPHPADAYRFLRMNPELFDYAAWPAEMPAAPPLELVAAYLGAK